MLKQVQHDNKSKLDCFADARNDRINNVKDYASKHLCLFASKAAAFILAEVLITLAIIGIFAALTIPTLISKIEKNILKAQIKENFSIFHQVHKKVYNDITVKKITSADGYKSEDFNNAVISNLNIVDVCNGNALENGCVSEYTINPPEGCFLFAENVIYTTKKIYVLKNGTLLIPFHMDWRSLWLIDVNGKKGPNKAGYDVFSLVMDYPDNFVFSGQYCMNKDYRIEGGINKDIKSFKDIDNW